LSTDTIYKLAAAGTRQEIPEWAWVLLITLLLSQGIFIFNDARKRGYNAWAWGAFGLLNVPSSLIIYYLVVGTREKNGRGQLSKPGERASLKPGTSSTGEKSLSDQKER